MNEIIIKSGESKEAVKRKLKNLTTEDNDVYLYYFPYQMQSYLLFDDDILTSATIEYVPMD